MSETGTVQSAVTVVPPHRKRTWLTALLLVVVFLCGTLCGAGVATAVIVRGVRNAIRHPERQVERQTRLLAARLKLDEKQREQVRNILTEQNHEIRPEIAARLEKTRMQIEKILTPGQQARFRILIQRWLPSLPEAPPPAAPAP
jgi:uncharacterized membrane protein